MFPSALTVKTLGEEALCITRNATKKPFGLLERQISSLDLDIWSSLILPSFPKDPAESFRFLVQFVRDGGLLCSFESDAVLEMLRKASVEKLKEHRSLSHSAGSDVEFIGSLQDKASSFTRLIQTSSLGNEPSSRSHPIHGLSGSVEIQEEHRSMRERTASNLGLVHLTSWSGDELGCKSLEMVSCLRKIVLETSQPLNRHLVDWSPQMEAKCTEFFSPSKIRIFLEAYWSIWSPNSPIIHRPTFNALTTPIPLLSALVVIGACHSPSPSDRLNARFWYDYVEEMVFDDPYFTLPISNHGLQQLKMHCNYKRRTVQAIQAAYTVCIYQNWDGSPAARLRIRRRRFGDVIAVWHLPPHISEKAF